MISEDDARTTVEFYDRYAILAPFVNIHRIKKGAIEGKPVVAGFRYASDTNTDWLSPNEFLQILSM